MVTKIKGIGRDIFIRSKDIRVINMFGGVKTYPYEDIYKIEYRTNATPYIKIITVEGKSHRIEFSHSIMPQVERIFNMISEKNPTTKFIDFSNEPIAFYQQLWFHLVLMIFFRGLVMPTVALILMWYYKASNVIVRAIVTTVVILIPIIILLWTYIVLATTAGYVQDMVDSLLPF